MINTSTLKKYLVRAGFEQTITDEVVEHVKIHLLKFFRTELKMIGGLKRWAEQEQQKRDE